MTVRSQQALLECQTAAQLWRHWNRPHSHWGAGKGAAICVGEVTHETKQDGPLQFVPAEALAGGASSLLWLSVLESRGCNWRSMPPCSWEQSAVFYLSTVEINMLLDVPFWASSSHRSQNELCLAPEILTFISDFYSHLEIVINSAHKPSHAYAMLMCPDVFLANSS